MNQLGINHESTRLGEYLAKCGHRIRLASLPLRLSVYEVGWVRLICLTKNRLEDIVY